MSTFYDAIDYYENIAPTALPVEYVATEFHFSLKCLLLHISDDTTDILTSKLSGFRVSLTQRPAANGLRYSNIKQFYLFTKYPLDRNNACYLLLHLNTEPANKSENILV